MRTKKNFLIVALLSLFMFYSCGKKDDTTKIGEDTKSTNKNTNPLGDKPILVEFKMSGSMNGTVKAIYYKTKARSESQIDMRGQKMSATAFFNGGDTMYIVTEFAGMKSGMKMNKSDFSKKDDQVDALTFKDRIKNMDKIGTEEIIGKKCDIYRSKDGKFQISMYNETVPLKFSAGDGKMVMEATKLEEDVNIDGNTFTPPSDVEYMDAGSMLKGLKNSKENTEGLKDKVKQMEEQMKKYKK